MTEQHSCYAIVPPGVEALTAGELSELGVEVEGTEPGGVSFLAATGALYRANLRLRTANRVVVRLAEFPARAFYELERKAKRLPWRDFLAPGAPVRFRVTSRKSRLYHQVGVAERLAAAAGGAGRPDPDPREEAGGDDGQLFLVRIVRDIVTISVDSSGERLHRRGYRQALAKAPLRETLAAAMLVGTGYDGTGPLLDPFCGSGTIPVEAALMARRIAPGLRREFAFERWPCFDAGAWRTERESAETMVLPRAPAPILGTDRDPGAIRAAQANAALAGVAPDVEFREQSIADLAPATGPGWVVTNPPYGVRVGEGADLRDLFARFGARLRERRSGWRLGVLLADAALADPLELPLRTAWVSNSGGIPVRLLEGAVP